MAEPGGAMTGDPQQAAPPPSWQRLTGLAVLVAALLSLGAAFWEQQSSLVLGTCQVGESVPTIPALAALFLLVAAAAVRGAWRRQGLAGFPSRAQIALIYCIVGLASTVVSLGGLEYFFASITCLPYFAGPGNHFGDYARLVPRWLVPQSQEVVDAFYESSAQGTVPWRAWLGPLAIWSVFFFALYLTLFCLMVLFYDHWAQRERLEFPLNSIPLVLTEESRGREGVFARPFLRNPIAWVGFAVAFVFNLLNILHAFNPSVPALREGFALSALLTERPWNAASPLYLRYCPALFGLGYLMPSEVLLTVWVAYLGLRFSNVIAVAAGYERTGFPFDREQSVGAYAMLALLLGWAARSHLATSVRGALRLRAPSSAEPGALSEGAAPPWACLGTILGVLFLWGWFVLTGMVWWGAAIFLFLVLGIAVTYARVRAETGAPMVWLFPWGMHDEAMIKMLGARSLLSAGRRTPVMLFVHRFVSRGYFPSEMALQGETLNLGHRLRISMRSLVAAVVLGLVLGLGFGYYVHLSAYYRYGDNVMDTVKLVWDFRPLEILVEQRPGPDLPRSLAVALGALVAACLFLVRHYLFRFPLHPLGFAIATAYGYQVWWPFMAVWLCKVLVMRLGGVRAYRTLRPAFLALAIGHFFMAGVVWGLAGISGGEAFRRFVVFFG